MKPSDVIVTPEQIGEIIQKWTDFYRNYQPQPAPKNASVTELLDSMPLEIGNVRENPELLQAWRNRTTTILDAILPVDDEGTHFFMEQYRDTPSFEFRLDMREFIEKSVDVAVAWSQFYNQIYLPWYDDNGGDYPEEQFTTFLGRLGFEIDDDGYGDGTGSTYGADSALNGDFQYRIFSIRDMPEWADETGLDDCQLAILTFSAYGRGGSEPLLFYTSDDSMLYDHSRGSLSCSNCGKYWDTENGGYSFESESYPVRSIKLGDLKALFFEQQLISIGFSIRWLPMWLAWFLFYRWGAGQFTFGVKLTYAICKTTGWQWHEKNSKPGSLRARLNLSPDKFFVGKHVYLPLWASYLPTRFKGWLARQRVRFWGALYRTLQGVPVRILLQLIFIRIPMKLYGRWWDRVPHWYLKIFNTYHDGGVISYLNVFKLEKALTNLVIRLLNKSGLTNFWQRYIWVHLLRGERKTKLQGYLAQRVMEKLEEGKDWDWVLDADHPEQGIILRFYFKMEDTDVSPLAHYHQWPPPDGKRVVGKDGEIYIDIANGETIHVQMYKNTHLKSTPQRPHFGYAYLYLKKLYKREMQLVGQGMIERFILKRWSVSQNSLVVIGDAFETHQALVRCPFCGHKHLEAYN